MQERQRLIDAGELDPCEPWTSGPIFDPDDVDALLADLRAAKPSRRRRGHRR
jgi:hypothetical protein